MSRTNGRNCAYRVPGPRKSPPRRRHHGHPHRRRPLPTAPSEANPSSSPMPGTPGAPAHRVLRRAGHRHQQRRPGVGPRVCRWEALPARSCSTAVTEIAGSPVPLSVDMEAGYAADPATIAENASPGERRRGGHQPRGRDGPPEVLCERIAATKRARAGGVDLFVNARTDVYLGPRPARARRRGVHRPGSGTGGRGGRTLLRR